MYVVFGAQTDRSFVTSPLYVVFEAPAGWPGPTPGTWLGILLIFESEHRNLCQDSVCYNIWSFLHNYVEEVFFSADLNFGLFTDACISAGRSFQTSAPLHEKLCFMELTLPLVNWTLWTFSSSPRVWVLRPSDLLANREFMFSGARPERQSNRDIHWTKRGVVPTGGFAGCEHMN